MSLGPSRVDLCFCETLARTAVATSTTASRNHDWYRLTAVADARCVGLKCKRSWPSRHFMPIAFRTCSVVFCSAISQLTPLRDGHPRMTGALSDACAASYVMMQSL